MLALVVQVQVLAMTDVLFFFHLEQDKESLLRHLDLANHLHLLLALFLLLQELPLARHIAAVTLGKDILAQGDNILAGNDAPVDGRL